MLSIPFFPQGANGATPGASAFVAATTSVQQIMLPFVSPVAVSIRIVVKGTSAIAWSEGIATGLTMGNGVVMLANTVEVFTIPPGVDRISVIADAAGSNVYLNVGDGE